jgi:hypothetical protein
LKIHPDIIAKGQRGSESLQEPSQRAIFLHLGGGPDVARGAERTLGAALVSCRVSQGGVA